MALDPLRRLLSPQEQAASLAALAPNQFQSPVLQRQTQEQPGGGVAPDYTPSVYNQQLDAQNAQTHAETDKRLQNEDALSQFLSPDATKVRQAQADIALAPEKLKNQNALDVEDKKTAGALAVAQDRDAALAKQNTDKQTAADAKANAPTNQIRTQATYAKNAMDLIGETDAQVSDPAMTPYIGNIIGRMTGLGTENVNLPGDFAVQLSADPATQKKLGDFGMNLVAAVSAVARAHNQRGATKELTQQFGSQIRASATPAMLHGALASAHRLMQGYAANDPGLNVGTPYGQDPLGQSLGMKSDPAGIR